MILLYDFIAQLYHNDKHQVVGSNNEISLVIHVFVPTLSQWYYYPRCRPDEMLVFTQCDSRADQGHAKHCFHTAFWDEDAPENSPRRQSVEFRFICGFEKGAATKEQEQEQGHARSCL